MAAVPPGLRRQRAARGPAALLDRVRELSHRGSALPEPRDLARTARRRHSRCRSGRPRPALRRPRAVLRLGGGPPPARRGHQAGARQPAHQRDHPRHARGRRSVALPRVAVHRQGVASTRPVPVLKALRGSTAGPPGCGWSLPTRTSPGRRRARRSATGRTRPRSPCSPSATHPRSSPDGPRDLTAARPVVAPAAARGPRRARALPAADRRRHLVPRPRRPGGRDHGCWWFSSVDPATTRTRRSFRPARAARHLLLSLHRGGSRT